MKPDTRIIALAWLVVALVGVGCGGTGALTGQGVPLGDDDAADDDDASDDDVGPDDDSADDDDVAPDDDDLCCSDCIFPVFVFDHLEVTVFLDSGVGNAFINELLSDAVPPENDDVIILFDPDVVLTGVSAFVATFGMGMATEDLYSWDPEEDPAHIPMSLDVAGQFVSTNPDLVLILRFGVALPLYEAQVQGTFSVDFESIPWGSITGAVDEDDTWDIETTAGSLHDQMDDRPLDVDLDGDGVFDAWTFEMVFTAFQFL